MDVAPQRRSAWPLRWLAAGLAVLGCLGAATLPGPPAVATPAAPFAPAAVTDTAGWFPFPQLGSDSSATVISANDLLVDAPGDNPATVIDRRGPVRTDNAGRFVFTNTGKRVRFWGVNISAGGAFPASPDFPPGPNEGGSTDDARALAARLAKLGFNAVRLHHLDNTWADANGTLWSDYRNNTQQLNPTMLGRLDYFIYQLKRHGIYVNLNLHVSRRFTPNDGVTAAREMNDSDTDFNKNTTLFDPVQIGLQKSFADALLNRVNPYTGLAYKDDPVIFSTETTNENSLFLGLAADQLNWYPGDPGSLPEFYDDQLDGWSEAGGPSTLNRLANGGFSDGLDGWFSLADGPAQAAFGIDGGALDVAITEPGEGPWQVQVGQGQLATQAGVAYEVALRVRSTEPTTIEASVGRDGAPWDNFGLAQAIPVTPEWTTQRLSFTADTTSFGNARLAFGFGGQGITSVQVDDIVFREASPIPGWHGWLADRYGSTAAIAEAWAPTADQQVETQDLVNPSFETGVGPWFVSRFDAARATAGADGTTATDGDQSLRVDIDEVGDQAWQVQVNQNALPLIKSKTYRLRFDARASVPGPIAVTVQREVAPFDNLGLFRQFDLDTDWRTFEVRFSATETTANAFAGFLVGQAARTIWIDNVSFGRVALIGLGDGESLEATSIARMPRSDWAAYSDTRIRDLITFYAELEADYFADMQRYLGQEIGARSLNTGTANFLDNLAHLPAMAGTDYIDNHFYWDYPSWPDGEMWEPTGWVIENESWLNNAFEDLFDKAVLAVKGKPYMITEYDSVAPNRYEVEAPLLLASFANLQDWDGVFKYDYVDTQRHYDAVHGVGYFTLAGNPVELGIMPVAARIFLAGQTAPAPTETALRFTPQEVLDSTRTSWGGQLGTYLQETKGMLPASAFGSRLRIASFTNGTPAPVRAPTPTGPRYRSAGGQLTWDVRDPAAARYLVTSPLVKSAVGFLKGQTLELNGLKLVVDGTPTGASANADFGAVTLQSLTDKPLSTTNEMLLSVVTRFENTGMQWNDSFTSVDDQWGGPPALIEPLLATATVIVADANRARVRALDPTGAPGAVVPHRVLDGKRIEFTVDTGRDRTLWYQIELVTPVPAGINGTVTGVDSAPLANVLVQSYRPQGTRWVTGPRVRTTASGTYTLAGLAPGRYRLRFTRQGFVPEFHADAATVAAGTDVIVEAGAMTTVDAVLRRR